MQAANLPPGANLVGVATANSWIWLNSSSAARYGTSIIDLSAMGSAAFTGAIKSGAMSALRIVPVAGNVIDGVSIGYEIRNGELDRAAYKTFDAAATAAAARYGKHWGAAAALGFNAMGGSESFARVLPEAGLAQACAAEMGMVMY